MDVSLFYQMINDKHFSDLKKLKYKYSDEFDSFLDTVKTQCYTSLPLKDFEGADIVYIESKVSENYNSYKLLMKNHNEAYGTKAVENEIISSSGIENIDYSRESVRSILKGYAPKDDAENRIYGMKLGFDFISDKSNIINEENMHKLYMMTIGDFLDEESKLLKGCKYRHDSVHIQDLSGNVSHTGISHSLLPEYISYLISFINSKDNMNELVKASVIHFYVAYLHPYFDGNGRMARLIHLWYLIQQGFDNTLFIPFSSYIAKSLKEYYKAYTLIEQNFRLSNRIDVTPFIQYFNTYVYDKFSEGEISSDTFDSFLKEKNEGSFTFKETQLWSFITSHYGKDLFSTKQLEKDYGNAAYATIRSFVLKCEKLGLLVSEKYSNRVKYRIK